MRRLNDIHIEVADRPIPGQPKAATQAPRSSARGRTAARRRGLSPFLWKKIKRSAFLATAAGALLIVPLWLTHTGSGHNLLDHISGRALDLSARAGFRVQDIFVEGRVRTPRDQILAALKVQRGDPMFGIDLSATRQRLEEISWVKSATIERRLPDEVHLILTERDPIVIWQNQGHYYLVDAEGQIVGNEIDEYGGLPLMVGEGAPDHATELVELLSSEPGLKPRVKAAQWVGERRWNFTLDRTNGGIEVRLPAGNAVAAWHELARLDHEQSLLERQVSVIDMRLPDRLVLRALGHGQTPVAAPIKHKSQPGKDA